jgi:hypothetical protein
LFYLRGVAPKEVKSSDIYWGALPWVGLQILMVVLVAMSPGIVTGLLDKGVASGPSEGLVIDRSDDANSNWDMPSYGNQNGADPAR